MTIGELLTRWSVRLAMLLYATTFAVRWSTPRTRSRQGLARLAWTAGCVAFLVHVVSSFAFYHHWSHADAYAATARRSAEMTGLAWGGGLYGNYAFTLLWVADVLWWWCGGMARYEARGRAAAWFLHGFMAFIAFNATVIFATGFVRWIALAACLGLVFLRVRASAPVAVSWF